MHTCHAIKGVQCHSKPLITRHITNTFQLFFPLLKDQNLTIFQNHQEHSNPNRFWTNSESIQISSNQFKSTQISTESKRSLQFSEILHRIFIIELSFFAIQSENSPLANSSTDHEGFESVKRRKKEAESGPVKKRKNHWFIFSFKAGNQHRKHRIKFPGETQQNLHHKHQVKLRTSFSK